MKYLNSFRKLIGKNFPAIIVILVLLTWILVIFSQLLLQDTYRFEGNIITQEMSFTYIPDSQPNKLFLDGIRQLKEIEWQGKQTAISLTGKFSIPADKNFQTNLSQLKEITIQLLDHQSKLVIAASDPNKSEIELTDLSLQPNTEISRLSYNRNSSGNKLSLCLQSANQKADLCRQDYANLTESSKSEPEKIGSLGLQLGTQPLTVSLTGYRIRQLPQLGQENSPLEFMFNPEASQMELNIEHPTSLSVKLSDSMATKSSEWIRGNLEVKNVKFFRPDRTGKVEDEFDVSTILKGDIRMAEQKLEIQPNQFLKAGKPGINKLRSVQINSESPQGLQVRFRGESESIEVGLDKDFPVDSIKPNALAKYLSKDGVTTLIAFGSAVTGSLISYLFATFSQSNQKN